MILFISLALMRSYFVFLVDSLLCALSAPFFALVDQLLVKRLAQTTSKDLVCKLYVRVICHSKEIEGEGKYLFLCFQRVTARNQEYAKFGCEQEN